MRSSRTAFAHYFRILAIGLITLVSAAAADSTYAGALPGGNNAFEANTTNFLGEGVAQGADDLTNNPALDLTNVTQLKFTLDQAKIETRDESAGPATRAVAPTVPLAPEPPPWAMMAMGAVVLIGVQRLRRKRANA